MVSIMIILVDGAKIQTLYNEEFELTDIGRVELKRASHVDPIENKWYVDLSPVDGPIWGGFKKRSQALKAEVEWIESKLLGGEKCV